MGNYYLTVSADADEIVRQPIAIATSAVAADVSAAVDATISAVSATIVSGSFVTTSAYSAAANSRILGVAGGDLTLVEDSSSVTVSSAFFRTGTTPLALGLSGSYIQLSALQICGTSGAQVQTFNHSAGTPEPCPIPQPYLWVSSGDSTAATSGNFGNGAVTAGVSSTGHMEWATDNTLTVSAAGMYRATLVGVMTTAANQNIVIQLYVNDVEKFIAGEFVHGLVDPDVGSMDWVGYMSGGDNIRVTHSSGSNSNFTVGSTLTVVRLA